MGTTPRGPTPRTKSSESVAAPYVVLPLPRVDAGRSMLEYDVDLRPAELLLGTSEQLVEQHELAPFVAVRQLDKK